MRARARVYNVLARCDAKQTRASLRGSITMSLISGTSRVLPSRGGGCVSSALRLSVSRDPVVFLPVPLSSSGLRRSFNGYRCYRSQVDCARGSSPAARFVCSFA